MISEFPDKSWTERGVTYIIRKIDETGSADRREGSGRPRSARTEENVEHVENLVLSQEGNPGTHISTRKIAQDIGISRGSVRNIVTHDLELHVYKRQSVQVLTDINKERRAMRAQQMLDRFSGSVRRIWFSDEKTYHILPPINHQNDRVYSTATKKRDVTPERLLKETAKFSPSLMVGACVSKLGKSSIVFIEPKSKINADYYCKHVLTSYLRDIRAISGRNFTFQQDGAPAHRAKHTIAYLQAESVNFIEPDMWPANSPDQTPMDYSIWEALSSKVYVPGEKIENISQLRERIVTGWNELSQRYIDRCIDEWRPRLTTCVQQNGGHVEQFYK
jgi:hypothetical protein